MVPELLRKLVADPTAVISVLFFLAAQGCAYWWMRKHTRAALAEQTDILKRLRPMAEKLPSEDLLKQSEVRAEVRRALSAAYVVRVGEEVVDPETAFAPERLLPRAYNARLDAAGPGVFTALGILGTFAALILSFSQIDFSKPGESIQPLLAGMTVAFINSLFGVGLSIWWTLRSRRVRHAFDGAAQEIQFVCEQRYGRPAHGSQLLNAFGTLQGGVHELRDHLSSIGIQLQHLSIAQQSGIDRTSAHLESVKDAVAKSSGDLLSNLAPKLEESFKSLVDMPFERLTKSVDQFRDILESTAVAQEVTLRGLNDSALALSRAQHALGESLNAAESCVSAFTATGTVFEGHLAAAAGMIQESQRLQSGLESVSRSLTTSVASQDALSTAFTGTITHLTDVTAAIRHSGEEFSLSAARLNSAVEQMQSIGPDTAKASVTALKEELYAAIDEMGKKLVQFGAQTANAYEETTGRIVRTVDDRTSDLTDRLSAELSTLAKQLPEATSEINKSVGEMRRQLKASLDSLQRAVGTLDTASTDALAGRLKLYDDMVAKAVDHFAGTLTGWDGKVDQLSSAAREVKLALEKAQAGPLNVAAGAVLPSAAELDQKALQTS